MFKKVVILLPLLLSTAAQASDVSKEISEMRNTALYAELYLIGDEVSPNHDLDQIDVMRIGCHYRTTSREDLSGLLNVVESSQVQQAAPIQWGLDTRIVLRVYADRTHYTTLLMGQDYIDAPSRGRYFGPDTGAAPNIPPSALFVEAKNGLQKSLRFWGAQHPALAVKPCHQ